MDDETVRRVGVAVVWPLETIDASAAAPDRWAERFPCLDVLPPFSLSWQTGAEVTPLTFGWGLIAPADSCTKN